MELWNLNIKPETLEAIARLDQWLDDVGITTEGSVYGQMAKLFEELREWMDASTPEESAMELGDCLVSMWALQRVGKWDALYYSKFLTPGFEKLFYCGEEHRANSPIYWFGRLLCCLARSDDWQVSVSYAQLWESLIGDDPRAAQSAFVMAVNKVVQRKGHMRNGVFVKES